MTGPNRTVFGSLAARFLYIIWPAVFAIGIARGQVQTIERDGITVAFSVAPIRMDKLMAGGHARFQFKITGTHTGTPLAALNPGAWVDPIKTAAPSGNEVCRSKIETFAVGALGSRAALDLNIYYVLTLNDNATISVVDPLFSFGGSKLLAMVFLPSPGVDWVLDPDGALLFVALPDTDQVAVVDTASWKIKRLVHTLARPERLALQHDGRFLWVACRGGESREGGVSVIDATELKSVADIPLGTGQMEIALDHEDRYAYVALRESRSVAVIDAWKRKKIKKIDVDGFPRSIVYSNLARTVYVGVEKKDRIVAIDGDRRQKVAVMETGQGVVRLYLSPDGRQGLALCPSENLVLVFDIASNRIVQKGRVGAYPDQIGFTDTLAYVRSLNDELVWMIPLDEIGKEGAPIPVIEFTGGHIPPGAAGPPCHAAVVFPAPEGGAVLLANPADETVYYYMEGMAAPMGGFKSYGGKPNAVLAVDRSLREISPGVYAAEAVLPDAGSYDVAFFLDSPRVTHCFSLQIEPDTDRITENAASVLFNEPFPKPRAGTETEFYFQLTKGGSDIVAHEKTDIEAILSSPTNWQRRQWAEYLGNGRYRVRFTAPKPGIYYLSISAGNIKLERPARTVTVVASNSGKSGVPSTPKHKK